MQELTPEIYESVIRKILNDKNDTTLIQFKDRYTEFIRDSRPSNILVTRGKNKGRILEHTYTRNVVYTFNRFIKHTGNLLLKDISMAICEKYILNQFNKSKYSSALDFRILRAAFNKAFDWGLIESNPFNKMKLPKIQKTNPGYVTREQLEIILEHVAPEKLKDVYRFAFLTGIRLSELTNLKWKNVNIKDKIIQIGDDSFITKSKKIRVIPICDEASKILADRVPKIFSKEKAVFCKSNMMPFTNDWLSKSFKRAVKKTELDQSIHFHSLRHSFASNLVKQGASIYHLKELLGHSSVAVTEIYSHLDVEALRSTVNRFNNVMSS